MIRDFQNVDDDIIRRKRIIKETLYSDPDIIELLNNPDLDPETPDEYLNKNIFPCIHIPTVQSTVQNYICFDIDDVDVNDRNVAMKEEVCTFRIFCHEDNIATNYGGERHDLLGYCIRSLFQWSNILGLQLKLTYNVSGTTDNRYVCRTMKFRMTTPSSLYKGKMDNPNNVG